MPHREPFWQPGGDEADTPETARARLAGALRDSVRVTSQPVLAAFAQVPRHLFVPEVAASAAYRDEALIIKCGPDGLPVSSSSQPAMMAIMLDQLGLQPGHKVLEIGTGSGYNAAVMAAVTGRYGSVVSIDIDAQLAARARASLAAAGYDSVIVRCADGGYGYPAGAPYDRIIVTAGAWDIAPAWLEQLGDTGRLVLPLSVRGIQLSVALERLRGEWVSASACRCGFVRMLGAYAGPECVLQLPGPARLYAQMSDGSPVDELGLQAALTGPAADEPVALPPVSLSQLADLDLWLTLTGDGLDRVTLFAPPGGTQLRLAPLLPFGGLVSDATAGDRMGIAILVTPDAPGGPVDRGPADLVVRGYGPGGARLAARLAQLSRQWHELGRPGVHDLELMVRPPSEAAAATLTRPAPGLAVLSRPSVTIEVGWPALAGV